MSIKGFLSSIALILACSAVFGSVAHASESKAPNPDSYCTEAGGVVQTRVPAYGTNGNNPLTLAGNRDFCQFTAGDGSQINVLTKTLAARMPTLAALAYYAQEPEGNCSGNPASCYCTQLGGSDQFGGTTGAGGGWVLNTNSADVLETCIFPDMSSIDSWGLLYHAYGIIRGADLSLVLRYQDPYSPGSRVAKNDNHLPY